MRHGSLNRCGTARRCVMLAFGLGWAITFAARGADPAPAKSEPAPTTPQAVPYWQAPALPAAVVQGGAIPSGWQPQAVPYQGVGPDGQPITMYFAPTYVFTYQAGPPTPAPTAVNSAINRPSIPSSQPQPAAASTGGWNYATSGTAAPATTLQPGAYTQYRPVYKFPADARALAGTPLVPPGPLPQPTTSAFAAAPPTAPPPAVAATMPPPAGLGAPVYGPPPNQWVPPDSSVATAASPPSDPWASTAPFAAAGTAAGIAATQPPPAASSAAIASSTLPPVVPPTVPVSPASSSPQPPPPRPSTSHLWRVVGVYDGDTITCLDENNQQQKVRLAGIDAPESSQDFGKVSREALASLVFGRTVEVTTEGRDRYGRWIGQISADDTNVNRQMVATGNAWHYTTYSSDSSLAEAQQQAQQQRLGLWAQDNPVPPWDYRKGGSR